uniref:Uncharacterized protein n=1 Tax=Oryza brachyantha TaxID=4533 RepID=J3MCA2_ORYBR
MSDTSDIMNNIMRFHRRHAHLLQTRQGPFRPDDPLELSMVYFLLSQSIFQSDYQPPCLITASPHSSVRVAAAPSALAPSKRSSSVAGSDVVTGMLLRRHDEARRC